MRSEIDRTAPADQQGVEDAEGRVGKVGGGHDHAAYGEGRRVILTRMAQRRDGVRWGRWILVAVVLAVINVPYLLHEWEVHRAATDGIPVTATVVGVGQAGDDAIVAFRLPSSVDSDRVERRVKVTRSVGAQAARTKQLEVRVLKDHPSVFHVDGEVRSNAALYIVIFADLFVVGLLLLAWRLGGRIRRPTLVGIAVEDIRSGQEGSLLDKQDDGTYLVNGEVARTGPASLVLSLRDRDVEIHLRDHDNPIGVGERATVRVQLVG